MPAGIIITGGGAGLSGIEEMAKSSLKLPSRSTSIKDSVWAVAYGLCILGVHADEDMPIDTSSKIFHNSKRTLMAWLKQFLP